MRLGTHFRNAGVCLSLLLAPLASVDAQIVAHGGAFAGYDEAAASAAGAAAASRRFLPAELPFAQEQLRYSRVRDAYDATGADIEQLFARQGMLYPAAEIFMRVFKRERVLELWARGENDGEFRMLKAYEICAAAGRPGPKRRQGDNQVPEGFYFIDLFNPLSRFHLSLRIDYPNRRDRAQAGGNRLGGDIFVHGDCVSAGCLAVTDDGIEELYWLTVEARALGQQRIPVHIFPARLTADEMDTLASAFPGRRDLLGFWETLRTGFEYFEQNRRVPDMGVDARGNYRLEGEGD